MPKLEDYLGQEILVTVYRWQRFEEDGEWKTEDSTGTSKMLLRNIKPDRINV